MVQKARVRTAGNSHSESYHRTELGPPPIVSNMSLAMRVAWPTAEDSRETRAMPILFRYLGHRTLETMPKHMFLNINTYYILTY